LIDSNEIEIEQQQ